MWKRRKPLKLVEIKAPVNVPLTPEGRRAVATLKDHPGFHYLLNRLRLQRATLEAALITRPHTEIADVAYLQAGIRWMNWLESQFTLAVEHPSDAKSRDANSLEEEAMKAVLNSIEGVGL